MGHQGGIRYDSGDFLRKLPTDSNECLTISNILVYFVLWGGSGARLLSHHQWHIGVLCYAGKQWGQITVSSSVTHWCTLFCREAMGVDYCLIISDTLLYFILQGGSGARLMSHYQWHIAVFCSTGRQRGQAEVCSSDLTGRCSGHTHSGFPPLWELLCCGQ